jgi:polar amino acid transport system substrate-binding protein
MNRAIVGVLAAAALVAGCGAGSTPPLPTVAPSSSGPAPSSSAPPAPGCDDNDYKSRVASYAPGASPADSATVAKIKSRNVLKAGVAADNLLFGYRNPITGVLEGFDIEVVNEVAKAIFGTASGHVEYVVENFAQRIPDLRSGKVDVVADIMTINCARWGQIAFSAEYFHAGQQVLVRKNAPYKRIEDLNGKKVCTATGSTGNENLKTRFPQVHRVIVDTISDCMVLFQQGAVEGIVSDNTVLNGFASQDPYAQIVGPQFTTEPYGLGFNRGNVDFVRYVNALLEKWRTDGTWKRIHNRWLPNDTHGQPAAAYGRALP